MSKSPEIQPFSPPDELDLTEKVAYAIGILVAEWSILESLFLGLMDCILSKEEATYALVVWESISSTRARVDLTLNLVRTSPLEQDIVKEIESLASRFQGVTRTRNIFCHGEYYADLETGNLVEFKSTRIVPTSEVVRFRSVTPREAYNELTDAINRCRAINVELWPVLYKVRDRLEAHYTELP